MAKITFLSAELIFTAIWLLARIIISLSVISKIFSGSLSLEIFRILGII